MATRIDAKVGVGWTFTPKYPTMMNAAQYRSYAVEQLGTIPEVRQRIGSSANPLLFNFLNDSKDGYYYNTYHNDTQWSDYVYRTRPRCFYGDYLKNDFGLKVFAPLFVNTKEQGLAPDRIRFIHSMSELNSGVFNPKPQLYDPLLSRLYDQKRQELSVKISQQKEGLATNVHYLELADVAPENTLQFLLDRYKGNVVMIDLWATWCGPCQLGHREMAPVKEELKDKNIVYLNLTSSTSPFEDWKRMVKDIPGEHYYVSNAQFDALHDLYKSEGGVPAYAIYNPKGELVLQQLGFSSVEPLKAGLLKALE